MSKCPFLSTAEEYVQCFVDCEFYNYSDNEGVCPFTQIKSSAKCNDPDLEKYDLLATDKDSFFNLKYNNVK
ncbi:hypothetical protein SAMN02745196_00645 [Clostridium collagenovorans DSM 3089]|uniref:Uncharacterized protein n=1 Tax=Clostridium collagenovorans DSM 3089 TaxID=1121306 RepID=A0A1M5TMS0_9CLOT|nr:hypothetical protein [Clostridium collagenovorans]SHH52004.1 hypothetical protein SAMN02745196_00645 [Clostridium collagenovorans DSM 3089]